jgi:hypothetical protein
LRTEAGQRAIAQVQAEYAGLKKPTETDKMPKASDHPGKYLTLPDGRVLQSSWRKMDYGRQLMPKFILSDEPPQQSVPGRFVLSDAPPAADNRNMLEKAAQWASDTFGANGNLRGSAVGGVMQGMADPVAGLVQMGANFRASSHWSAIRSMRASPATRRNTKRRGSLQGAADLMLLASSETSRRRPM